MNKSVPRDATIDVARGIAIVAIVLGHVMRGLESGGIVDGTSFVYQQTDRVLYLGHLAVFAFLSGLFLKHGVMKRGLGKYLSSRLTLFLYLYVLWSFVQGFTKLATGALVNSPVSIRDVFALWRPEGQLWFLPFLMIVTVAAALLRAWRNHALTVTALCTATMLSVASWGYSGDFAGTAGLALVLPFFIGVATGAERLIQAIGSLRDGVTVGVVASSTAALVVILLFTNAIPPTVNSDHRKWEDIAFGVAATTCAVLAVLATSRLLAQIKLFSGWFAFLGQRSMEIFLAHIIAASGTRIALTLIGVDSPTAHILLGTTAGTLLPLVLWATLQRFNFPWLFTLPGFRVSGRTGTVVTGG